MISILVLEDRTDTREILCSLIKGVSGDIMVYGTADLNEVQEYLKKGGSGGMAPRFDAFFLDINLNTADETDMSGYEAARMIRTIYEYEFTPIIMVTSVAGMEIKAYRELHCYQYIIKPFKKNEVTEVVQKLIQHKQSENTAFVMVKKDGINYRIDCRDILYIEAVPRGICLHLRNENMRVPYITIRQIIEKLDKKSFLQCHRMYVINIEHIAYVDIVNQFVRMRWCDENLDIGVTYKNDMKKYIQ